MVTAASGEEALKQVLRTGFAVILLNVLMPTVDCPESDRHSWPMSYVDPIGRGVLAACLPLHRNYPRDVRPACY